MSCSVLLLLKPEHLNAPEGFASPGGVRLLFERF
jgi:hypothetical protein